MCDMCEKMMKALENNQLACEVGYILQQHSASFEIKLTDDGVFVFKYVREEGWDYPAIRVEGAKIICPAGTNFDIQMELLTIGMK